MEHEPMSVIAPLSRDDHDKVVKYTQKLQRGSHFVSSPTNVGSNQTLQNLLLFLDLRLRAEESKKDAVEEQEPTLPTAVIEESYTFLKARLDALNEKHCMPFDKVPEWWWSIFAVLLEWRQSNPTIILKGTKSGCSVLPPITRATIVSRFSAMVEDYFRRRKEKDKSIDDVPFPSDELSVMNLIMSETEFAEVWNGYADEEYEGLLSCGGLVHEFPSEVEDEDVKFSFQIAEETET